MSHAEESNPNGEHPPRIAGAMRRRTDTGALLREMAAISQQELEADRVTLWRYHVEDDTIEFLACSGLSLSRSEHMMGRRAPVTTSGLATAVRELQPVMMFDSLVSTGGSETEQWEMQQLGIRTMLVVPCMDEGKLFGLMSAGYRTGRSVPPGVLQTAETLSNSVAKAIAQTWE